MVRGNHPALLRRGAVQLREHLTSAVLSEAAELAVRSGTAYRVGEHILLSGANVIPGSSDKYGYLRRVTAVNGNVVVFDAPVPRAITTLPRASSVRFAPTLKIYGEGEIYNLDPTQGRTSLVDFFATESPQVLGISVHHNGGSGVSVTHSLNGLVDCNISDLLDDGRQYFGYGVLVAGASRGLTVRGTMTRVRHAVTTGAGPTLDSIGAVGEPEDCLFAPTAIDCSDKSIDTHRAGWNTTIIPTVVGGRGGVQIRADNTRVLGGSVTGSWGPGVSVDPLVQVPARIQDLTVTNLNSSGSAILSHGPSITTNITIRNSFGPNIVLNNNCIVEGGSISAGNAIGVSFLGSNNVVNRIQLGESVTTPFVEAVGAVNNVFTTAPPTDITLLPAPRCTTAPVLSGTATVGQQIASTYGTWNEAGIRHSWTFTRNGVPITGAVNRTYPRYDLIAADAGAVLGVTVTVTKPGFEPGMADSSKTATVALAGPLKATTAPVLSGTAMVGQQISSSYGVWNQPNLQHTWTFTRNGIPIAGAVDRTYPRYDITVADAGAVLGVVVRASKAGWISGTADGGKTAPIALAGPLKATTAPSITGMPTVGSYLTINKGTWTPTAQKLEVAWLINGQVLAGVTTNTFRVRSTDPGKTITARVTASREGWKSGVATTPGVVMRT